MRKWGPGQVEKLTFEWEKGCVMLKVIGKETRMGVIVKIGAGVGGGVRMIS